MGKTGHQGSTKVYYIDIETILLQFVARSKIPYGSSILLVSVEKIFEFY